ncbi:MAG TPA: DUF3761 domain-containing protein [Pseudonocardiaceae bacterium]|jgi:hypothetical protein|nr:DUF3761 domain-containing protein [Pseudonocardiaceae bacterium]
MPTRKSTPLWLSAIAAAVLVGGFVNACSPDIGTTVPVTSTTTDAPTTTTIAPAPVPVTTIPAPPPVTEAPQVQVTQAAPDCGSGSYVNSDGQCVPDPVAADSPPAGATAKCNDGTYSFSKHHSGTCSGHHGVAEWLS